ncbi:MAG TPA: hypothetical protein VKV27_13565 [Solirubrobacteraceae bacterium]|nr:hypothetical protein [Solirubrobacteraceae bacterium]
MFSAACAVQRSDVDRCPGVIALHPANDGLLARLRVPGGRLTAAQLSALARAASLGNGVVEITSRANIQLRGLPRSAERPLRSILGRAGLVPSPAHDRVLNVIASPLAGRHSRSRADTDGLLRRLVEGICAQPDLTRLPGRILFSLDDGSGLALRPAADLALTALGSDTFTLTIAGQPTRTALPAERASDVAVSAALVFTKLREALGERGRRIWRIAELDDGAQAIAQRLGLQLVSSPAGASPGSGTACTCGRELAPGRLVQRDGRVALTALAPLGRLDPQRLAALAQLAPELRLGTGRTLTLRDLSPAAASRLSTRLIELGLVLDGGSGWVGLSACSGFGACRRAAVDLRAAIEERARRRRPGQAHEHWAACERRCGERSDQRLAVATRDGSLLVRIDGAAVEAGSVEEALSLLAGASEP